MLKKIIVLLTSPILIACGGDKISNNNSITDSTLDNVEQFVIDEERNNT